MTESKDPYSYVSIQKPIPPLPNHVADPAISKKMARTKRRLNQLRKAKLTHDMLIKTLHSQATTNLQKITIHNRLNMNKHTEPITKPPPFPDQMMSDDRRMRLNYEFMKKCVQSAPIPTMSEDTWESILTLLPPELRDNTVYFPLIDSLHFEIEKEYEQSLRRYNVATTLLKPDAGTKTSETRMKFDEEGLDFSTTWRKSFDTARLSIAQRLNLLHPAMQTILNLSQKYLATLLIDCSGLRAQGAVDAENMKNNVILDCEKNEEKMMNSWFHEVVNIFYDKKSFAHIRESQQDSFYNCVSQLMSNILTSMLVNTIEEWVKLFDPEDKSKLPLYKLQLVLEDNVMTFSPTLDELEDVVKSVVDTVSKSLQNVPSVQTWLSGVSTFTPIKSAVENSIILYNKKVLSERLVEYFKEAKDHLATFENKYKYLVDGTAQKEIADFLDADFELEEIFDIILRYKGVSSAIASEDSFAHCNLIDLNVDQLKNSLIYICNGYVSQLLKALVAVHVKRNNEIISEFEFIKATTLKKV